MVNDYGWDETTWRTAIRISLGSSVEMKEEIRRYEKIKANGRSVGRVTCKKDSRTFVMEILEFKGEYYGWYAGFCSSDVGLLHLIFYDYNVWKSRKNLKIVEDTFKTMKKEDVNNIRKWMVIDRI